MSLRLLSAAALLAGLAAAQMGGPAQAQDKDTKGSGTPAAGTTTPAAKPNPDFQAGVEELGKGNFDKAVEKFKAARKMDPLLEPPLILIAKIIYAQGNNGQAARQLTERAGAENPEDPDPLLLSGGFALNEGRFMDAMLCFESALAKSSSPAHQIDLRARYEKTAREGLAKAYAQRNEFNKALGQLKALLQNDPKNAQIRWEVARLNFYAGGQTEGSLAEVFSELKKAHDDDGKNPAIGLPEINMARFWDSRSGFKKEDEDKETAKNKAQAEQWYKKAIEAYAKDNRGHREYGRWLLNNNRGPDADKELAAAKSLDGGDNETDALIGLSHRYKKEYTKAAEIFNKLNFNDPNNMFYAWNRALSLAESAEEKDRQTALSVASMVLQSQQKNPEAWSVQGWCLFKMGRNDEADAAFGNALKAGNNVAPPDTVYFISKVSEARGKGADTVPKLKEAVESKAAFVYRKDAESLFEDLKKKYPDALKAKTPEPKQP